MLCVQFWEFLHHGSLESFPSRAEQLGIVMWKKIYTTLRDADVSQNLIPAELLFKSTNLVYFGFEMSFGFMADADVYGQSEMTLPKRFQFYTSI